MDSSVIKNYGRFFQIDKNGYVVNDARFEDIDKDWMNLIHAYTSLCVSKLGKDIHSIYIRGSVARGLAIKYISDLDGICILKNKIDLNEVSQIEKTLRNQYDFTKGIEILTCDYEEFVKPDKYKALKMILKTQSLCVYGQDLSNDIKNFRPDKEMIIHLYELQKRLDKFIINTSKILDSNKIKDWVRWLCKGVIRSAFELVMERDCSYTRDLYLCYTTFIKYYPNKSEELARILEITINPTDEIKKVIEEVSLMNNFLTNESKIAISNS